MTVRGDSIVLADDFSGTLSQWTSGMGSGYCIQNGELVDTLGGDNVLINSSSATFGDGIIGADVRTLSGDYTDANLVVRYQDASNFYLIQVFGGQVIIFKRYAGTYYAQASVGINPHFTGGFYRLQATVIGGAFTVYWKGQQVLTWTDTSPWTSGKVGVRQCNTRKIHWDNFSAITFTTGQVVAYDDFYPFGQQMEGRSLVAGSDARYKYTGKERDVETGWDYFGARYYDSRIGRWLSVDPLAEKNRSWSPYSYTYDSPLRFIDPNGKDGISFLQRLWNATKMAFGGGKTAAPEEKGQTTPLSPSENQTLQNVQNATKNVEKQIDKLPEVGGVIGRGAEVKDPTKTISGNLEGTISLTTKGNYEVKGEGKIQIEGQPITQTSLSFSNNGFVGSAGGLVGGTTEDRGGVVERIGFHALGTGVTGTATITGDKIKYESTLMIGTFIIGLNLTLPR